MASRPATPARAARTASSDAPRAGDPIPGRIGAGGRADAALIAAVSGGDPAALDQLFLRYRRDAFGAAVALLRDPHAAEDAVHDAFLSVWRSARTFQPGRGSAKTWILAIARNAATDRLRAGQLAQRRQSALISESVSPRQDDVAAMATMAVEARRLHAAMAALPPPQRAAVELAYFADLSHSQIAERTGAPLGTVKGRIRLGLQRLRQDLGDPATPSPTKSN